LFLRRLEPVVTLPFGDAKVEPRLDGCAIQRRRERWVQINGIFDEDKRSEHNIVEEALGNG
jgi:hypothetical protein